MPAFTKGDKKVFFIHIPKSAGTSVQSAFEEEGYSTSFFNAHSSDLSRCCPQHYHGELLEYLGLLNDSDFNFAIVRNPLDRLLSEYYFRKMQEKNVSQDVFVNAVFLAYKINPFIFDNHIRPQCEFVNDSTEVFYFEDGVEKVFDSLKANGYLNKVETVPHFFKSKGKKIAISKTTLKKIKHFYNEDFAKFNYKISVDSNLSKPSILVKVQILICSIYLALCILTKPCKRKLKLFIKHLIRYKTTE